MSENMKKFLEMASKDENLKNKLTELEKMEPTEAISTGIAMAKELGIELSEADFAMKEASGELSDDELDAVAGGDCGCFAGGGGTVEYRNEKYTCACVGAGGGARHCFCLLAGAGTPNRCV